MSKYIELLKTYLTKALRFASRYSLIIFVVVFASMAGYLVTRIGVLSRAEPSQAEIDEKLKDIKAPKSDSDAVAKLKELEDKNISVEALFDNGRTNPFQN